jgi:pimeloyl-ACP methyl ester carboxylesterase
MKRFITAEVKLEVVSKLSSDPGKRPPLLFVHGTGHGAWCWDETFLPYFAANGFDSHALSLRGHGKSQIPSWYALTSIADYVEDIRFAAEGLREAPVLIGHSLGGLVVAKYLERYRSPASVLIAPSPATGMLWSGMKVMAKNPLLMAEVSIKRDYAVMYRSPRKMKKFLFSEDSEIETIATYSSMICPESYRASLETMFVLPRPEKIDTPMLIVGAERDAILTERTIRRTAKMFSADCEMAPGVAHDMMLEQNWKNAADVILHWLGKNLR